MKSIAYMPQNINEDNFVSPPFSVCIQSYLKEEEEKTEPGQISKLETCIGQKKLDWEIFSFYRKTLNWGTMCFSSVELEPVVHENKTH